MMKNRKNSYTQTIIFILLVLIAGTIIYSLKTSFSSRAKNFNGHYEYCQFKDACSFIDIKTLRDGKISVDGQAYWVGSNITNTGSISGIIAINSDKANYEQNGCTINFSFSTNQITAKESQNSICGGLNVSFDGIYIKK